MLEVAFSGQMQSRYRRLDARQKPTPFQNETILGCRFPGTRSMPFFSLPVILETSPCCNGITSAHFCLHHN